MGNIASANAAYTVAELFHCDDQLFGRNIPSIGNGCGFLFKIHGAGHAVEAVDDIFNACLTIFAGHAVNVQNRLPKNGGIKRFVCADRCSGAATAAATGKMLLCAQNGQHSNSKQCGGEEKCDHIKPPIVSLC